MTIERFFELFLEELKLNPNLTGYYKYNKSVKSFEFRKAYFAQRLQYIIDHLEDKDGKIWDCGCGFGTTAIFLALNGYKVEGSTLEFYYKEIPKRIQFWSQFGDVSSFTYNYENVFEKQFQPHSFSYIIVQDTLHHLEPFQEILKAFKQALKPKGKLIAIEENGNNIFIRTNRYRQRGNNRIVEMYDEMLKKNILIGNENIRSYNTWKREFNQGGFQLAEKKYIRLFFPYFFRKKTPAIIVAREQNIWRKNAFLREYFFFGLNFVASVK